MDDTIVAIATPPGEGGLGVIRLSGPHAIAIADQLLATSSPLHDASTHTLHHGWLRLNNRWLDEAVAGLFRAPRSYTGEDVVELSCHGSPRLLLDVVHACVEKGARPARPGEFTERAFRNGKMDLARAEAVADLIHAHSSRAVTVAALQLKGVLSDRLRQIRSQLIDLLARTEAHLDFSDEDIPAMMRADLLHRLQRVNTELETLLSTSLRGRQWREGLRLVLAGKPNVGKSSLFNALLAENRAIVTDRAGTTRDTLEESIQWKGVAVTVVDTAGMRATDDPVETEGVRRAHEAYRNAGLVLWVVDASTGLDSADRLVLEALPLSNTLAVLNKSDQASLIGDSDLAALGIKHHVSVSAKTGQGLAQLVTAVLAFSRAGHDEPDETMVVTRVRHLAHLEKASGHIQTAQKTAQQGLSEETWATDIRAALLELGAITGEGVTEDVLSAIFKTFCIGK